MEQFRMRLTYDEAAELVKRYFDVCKLSEFNGRVLTELVLKAEFEGGRSHGLLRLPDYVASIRTGWIDAQAEPVVVSETDSTIVVDCQNGFTQVGSWMMRKRLTEKVAANGLAMVAVRNGHHIGALWTDIEYLSLQGLVALNFVNSRCRLAAYGAGSKLLGTNAMAFSCPDGNGSAITWDQASSTMSLGEIKLHMAQGKALPDGVGLDAAGNATTDAAKVLKGGSVLPFAGHKGSSVALMVEIMAAGLTGGNFGFEDKSLAFPGAASSNAGQLIIAIDPNSTGCPDFSTRMTTLVSHLHSDPAVRLPGEARTRRRKSGETAFTTLSDGELELLRAGLEDIALGKHPG